MAILAHLQKMNVTHGDLRPELVFARVGDSEDKTSFKLMDRLSDQGTSMNTQLNNVVVQNNLYLSPLYYQNLSTGKLKQLSPLSFS